MPTYAAVSGPTGERQNSRAGHGAHPLARSAAPARAARRPGLPGNQAVQRLLRGAGQAQAPARTWQQATGQAQAPARTRQQATGQPPAPARVLQRAAKPCPDPLTEEPTHPGTCPEIGRDPDEADNAAALGPSLEEIDPDSCYLVINMPVAGSAVGTHPRVQEIAQHLIQDTTARAHLTGYSDCPGTPDENAGLRLDRAQAMAAYLAALGVPSSQISVDAAPLTEYPDSNDTAGGRARNRSVGIYLEHPSMDPGLSCAPGALPSPAGSFSEYVSLVVCAERALPGYSPREMLSLLRQIYYGHNPWSRTQRAQWRDVIPCGINLPDPRPALGTDLFDALRNSQESTGIDIGHMFTGLEAMFCPTPNVSLTVDWWADPVVAMPNEEFATWGGDLGSASAQRMFDELDQGITRPAPVWPHYFGPAGTRVSDADMEGNIDSYVIRQGLTGAACGRTAGTRIPSLSGPVSQILHEYYTQAPTAMGRARADRFRCFAQALGATVAGNRITNRVRVVDAIWPRVDDFARVFYIALRDNPFAEGNVALRQRYSREVTRLFVDWVEARL